MLAVIGPHWDPHLLVSARDFVRIELTAAEVSPRHPATGTIRLGSLTTSVA